MSPLLVLVSLLLLASTVLFGLLWWASREEVAGAQQRIAAAEAAAAQRVALVNEELTKCKDNYSSLRTKAEARVRELMDSGKDAIAETERWKAKSAEADRLVQKLRLQLSRWQSAVDAEAEAERFLEEARVEAARIVAEAQAEATEIRKQADAVLAAANQSADELVQRGQGHLAESQRRAKALREEADHLLAAASEQAAAVVKKAEEQAKNVAGEAYDLKSRVVEMEKRLRAIRNQIEGYGDEYIIPAHSLLDDLAEAVSYKDAGQRLKAARAHTRDLVRQGRAASCEYVEENRRKTAVDFVVDAFNGKVDSALSRVKHDNAGKLSQEIMDAFHLVNANGEAFRKAQITTDYLNARLSELKWAAIAQEIKRQEIEEQRQIREQIREEEKARREYQRAIKEAAREEEAVQKAMAKLSEQMAKASESQRAAYEQQLAELQGRLAEAEERGQRAMSMAQLTKSGHVYIISNVGSFGENVYKIGLTRRLDPLDRVRELGDSSVPFGFDVHALIKADDAPALEHQLHRHFLIHQVNKVNHRKEFFRVDLETIRAEVEALGLESQWTMIAEAAQFRESLAIERRIAEDPVAREQWLMRQLELELVEAAEPTDDEAVLSGASDEDDG